MRSAGSLARIGFALTGLASGALDKGRWVAGGARARARSRTAQGEGRRRRTSSFSSDTRTAHEPDLTSALMKMSLERTSSFFWSSPLEFCSPAMPNKLAIPAFAHARDVALQARASWAISTVSCGVT